MSGGSPSSRRQLVESSTLGAGALLGLVLLAIVNYLGWKYYQRFDWTASRLYTLSEKSANVLGALDKDVEVVVFMAPGEPLFDPVRELLSRYEAASERVRVRVVDPAKNPAEAQLLVDRFELDRLNVVVFESGDERRVIDGDDLAEYDYSGFQFGQSPEMTAFTGEAAFTGAILELAESRRPTVRFTTGHGELEVDDVSPQGLSDARDLLGRDNVSIESWASLGSLRVPEGTDLVVIAGPTARFVEPEVAALEAYLAAGGRLLALLDPALGADGELTETGLEGLLARYGVKVGRDVVVDPANPLPFYGADTIFAGDYGSHPVTRSLDQARVPVILPLARSVGAVEAAEGLEVEELLRTTEEGWGETDLAEVRKGRVEKGEGDLPGPVPLGVAVSAPARDEEGGEVDEVEDLGQAEDGPAEEGEEAAEDPEAGAEAPASGTRLVVLGDSDFATNGQLPNVGNAELLANVMNWLVERETLIGIPPKQPEQVRLSLSSSQLSRLTWLVLGLLPGLAVAAGVAVYLRRRG